MSELSSVVEQAVRLGKMARVKREAVTLLGDESKLFGDRASLEMSWKRAQRGLWMAYQPIVRFSERSVFAYEAIMRSNEATLPHPAARGGQR
jgi:EAL domain-containing protein (putative c-di-GMP-specific phosphodiesterase class I)